MENRPPWGTVSPLGNYQGGRPPSPPPHARGWPNMGRNRRFSRLRLISFGSRFFIPASIWPFASGGCQEPPGSASVLIQEALINGGPHELGSRRRQLEGDQ